MYMTSNSMLRIQEKVLLGLVIIFAAVVAAHFVIPPRTYEVSLVTNPNGQVFYVPAGEHFNITCRGSGDDEEKFASMKWLNVEGNVIAEGIPGVQRGEKNSLVLIFTNPKFEESGIYKCVAVYDKKHTLQSEVTISFYVPGTKPDFRSSFQNVTAEEDSYLEVPCVAVGDKPISYEWYNQYEDKITRDTSSSIFVSNSDDESNLIITNVKRSHEGTYTCSASNQHGLSSKIYQLLVQQSSHNETSSFRDATVVNITSTSVKFDLTISQPVRLIEVKYSESRNASEFIMQWNYGDNYEVKGLIPSGFYTFKFRVIPSDNDAWSRPYQVILLPDVPDVTFRNLGGRSVQFEWLRKFEDFMRETIDQHELTYFGMQMEGGSRWIPSKCAITIQIPSCAGSSYTISNLNLNSYYEIQLRAHTASGYGEPYKQKIYVSQ